MRILESRVHRVYMTVEEFDLFYAHTKEIGYGYTCESDEEIVIDEEPYLVMLYDDMLEDCYDLLKEAMDYEKYHNCDRIAYEELKELLDTIYYEMNY